LEDLVLEHSIGVGLAVGTNNDLTALLLVLVCQATLVDLGLDVDDLQLHLGLLVLLVDPHLGLGLKPLDDVMLDFLWDVVKRCLRNSLLTADQPIDEHVCAR
jgi:hypothetical protein